jgi:hypothetical protein
MTKQSDYGIQRPAIAVRYYPVMKEESIVSCTRQKATILPLVVLTLRCVYGVLYPENVAKPSKAIATAFGALYFLLMVIWSHLPAKTQQFDYGKWSQENAATS